LGDPSDVRVGQALAEELTTALAQVPRISLRSASRSRAAADAGGDLAAIGRLLDARLILDGGVQHDAHRWRITLRLVQVADEVAVWARAFDLEAHDLIAEQERVAKATVEELRPWLQEQEE
jgi:TolB-like protein